MSTIDDIGYLPQRISTPESREQYILKGPTKSPPPIFMPKPVYAVAPTQKLVQQHLRLQEKQYYPLSSSPVLVNSLKPMSAITATTTANPVNNISTSILQQEPQQPQQATSSSAPQPQTSSVNKPPHLLVSKVTFDTLNDPAQQHQHPPSQNHYQHQSQSPQPLAFKYKELLEQNNKLLQQNRKLQQQVKILRQQEEEMYQKHGTIMGRVEILEREIQNLRVLRPSGSSSPGGGGDNLSEDYVSVRPAHSRSAPTATATSGYPRQSRRADGRRDVHQCHNHQHRHHHRSRSVRRQDTDSYRSRSAGPRTYDNYHDDDDDEGSYVHCSPSAEEEDEEDRIVVEEEEEEEEDCSKGEYAQRSRQGLGRRRPSQRQRSGAPSRPLVLSHGPSTSAVGPIPTIPLTAPRRPPPMDPGRYPLHVIHPPPPSMSGMRVLPGARGSAGRNPDQRTTLRHRHSDSYYRPSAASHWQGGYEKDYNYDSYDEDTNYPQSRYRRSGGGASSRFRYPRRDNMIVLN